MNKKFRVLLSAFLSVAIVTSSMPLTAAAESFGSYESSAITADTAEQTAEETTAVPAASNSMLSIIEARKNASAADIAALKEKISAGEATGSCGTDATWSIDNNLTLTISGSGEMTGYSASDYYINAAWQEYAPVVTKIVISDNITSIGSYDFSGFVAVTSVTVGKGVTLIDNGAFYGCTALASLSFSSTNTLTAIGDGAFYDCTPLKSLSIPTSVLSIGKEAFGGCKAITTVTVPAGVSELGEGAFYGCEALKTVTLSEGVSKIGVNAFGACIGLESIVLPSTLTEIGKEAFNGCSSLTTINGDSSVLVFPENVSTIGEKAFANCNSIKAVTLAGNISSIAKEAFSGCVGLTALIISGTTQEPAEIGESAFAKTTNLTGVTLVNVSTIGKSSFAQSGIQNITLNEGLVTINDSAFESTSLKSIKFPSTVTDVKQKAFQNCLRLESVSFADGAAVTFMANVFNGCISLKTLDLEGVKVYGAEMFKGCTALTEVTLSTTAFSDVRDAEGNATATINQGGKVFSGCTALKKVNAPEGVKVITTQMFLDCPITEFTIPSTVTTTKGAFKDHTDLKKVVSNAEVLGSEIFSGCVNLTDVTLNNTKYLGGSDLENPPKTVDKTGNAFAGCESLESITLPESLVYIYPGCFQDCFGLTEITIPDSVLVIESGLFENCKYLKKVEYGDVLGIGDETFKGCTELTEIPLPDTLQIIGYGAFSGCTGITAMTIPEGVTYIDKETFSGCTNLRAVFLKGEVTSIGNKAFYNCENLNNYQGLQAATDNDWLPFSIPSTVTSIGNEAFSGCIYLDCEIPAGVTTLGDKAFYNCESLGKTADIVLPSEITKIGTGTFYNCKNLPNVSIGSKVTSIGASAFYGCCSEKFTRITIPAAVTQIGASAFEGCTNLQTVTILNGTKTLGGKAFYNCTSLSSVTLPTTLTSIGANAFENCSKLESVLISSAVTSLGNAAFKGCSSLKTAALSATQIKTLNNEVFSGCTSLTAVELPDTVTSIGASAFEGCSALAAITIPGAVKTLGNKAFMNCSSLESVVLPVTVTSFGGQTFDGCSSLTAAIVLSTAACNSKPFNGAENVIIYGYEGAGIIDYAKEDEIPYELLTGSNGTYLVILKQPQNITDVEIGDTVELSVKAASEGTLTYTWYYKLPGSSSYTAAANSNSDKYSFTLTEANNGVQVYCSIKSVSETAENTVKSDEATVLKFLAPTNLNATAGSGGITLKWTASANADSYEVYRADSANGEKTLMGTTTSTSYTDTTVTSKTTYYYFVKAVADSDLRSDFSDYVEITSAESKLEAFVERLYVNMLGRASDANGKAKWVAKLESGSTAADVAVNFVISTEIQQQKLSNETFVKRMYQTMLNRTPSDSEVTNWASYLDAGCTYEFIFRGFLSAPEFSKLCTSYGIETGTYSATENRDVNGKLTKFISRLYTKALNRTYDVSGLNHHTGNYISGKYTLDKIASGFIFSAEFEKRNLSDEKFVECMYNTFFDRASDASGKAKWLQKMANGMTREEVFNGFVISAEYKALVKSFGL